MADKTVLTLGTFDCLHVGHVNLLRQCAKIGRVVVGLNPDGFIERYKGRRPLYSYEERKKHLESLEYVDVVVPNSGEEDSKVTIRRTQPDFIVIGDDWAKKDYYKQMDFTQEWLDLMGITLLYVPYYKHISTSDIKKRICESQL